MLSLSLYLHYKWTPAQCLVQHLKAQMGRPSAISILFALIFFFFLSCLSISYGQLLPIVDQDGGNESRVQIYIVHVLKPEKAEFLGAEDLANWHRSFLPNTTLDSGKPRLVYSYQEAISGFAAWLTEGEVHAMEQMEGFLLAQPSQRLELQTTYTHEFLNLSTPFGVWSTSNSFYGRGIIIGVLDTGIHPSHPSFFDVNLNPPQNWNASCYLQGHSCNNKIIGAQAFYNGAGTIKVNDTNGHGTHVAGIAAGSFVQDAEVLGQAKGRAAGTAPEAHISVYKVCWPDIGCESSGVLAAIEQAIKDKVHILQMSFGLPPPWLPTSLAGDSVAIATFTAVEKGIFPCTAGGNSGPNTRTLSHGAPWDMVVGASTTDRRIKVTVTLGDANSTVLRGETACQQPCLFANNSVELEYPGKSGVVDDLVCNQSISAMNLTRKIVICYPGVLTNIEKGDIVRNAGGAAMIVINWRTGGFTTFAEPHNLPAAALSYQDGERLLQYFFASVRNSTTPTARINYYDTVKKVRPAPAVASFSSRGPVPYNGNIIKPDVVAPGVNILSAWPFEVGPMPTGLKRKTFNFESGTSMATPHVSGIAALIMSKLKFEQKRLWSPSEIMSALITTANTFDLDGNPMFDEGSFNANATVHSMGAGQVNVSGAMDPGLVYPIAPADYLAYLCERFSNNTGSVSVFTKSNNSTQCSRSMPAEQLNYPSIGVKLASGSAVVNVSRTVKNVGDANEVYWAKITPPNGVTIDLSTYRLAFSRLDQEITYGIRFGVRGVHPARGSFSQGALSWTSGKHTVTSPVYVLF